MLDVTTPLAQLREVLRRSRNADGGWGYYAGKASRLEPTCWALLALRDADPDVLVRWPERDGLLLERRDGEPNYAFHGLALLTLLARGIEHAHGTAALSAAIQRVAGRQLPESKVNRQNNSIQGWSWIDGTFSWVEPTAWCLLALKKCAGSQMAIDVRRMADAEALLVDRCCKGGGWNYGNSNMLGQDLAPYVPTTSVALLALQDRQSEPAYRVSLEFLVRDAASEQSAVALSLAAIALRALGRSADDVEAALQRQLPTTIALGNTLAESLALYTLGNGLHDGAFAL